MQLGPSIDASDGDDLFPAPEPAGPPGPAGVAGQVGSGGDRDEEVRHPEVVVELTGRDGNAYAILGAVGQALRRAGHAGDIAEFLEEATSGDNDQLLQTCMRWVTVT
jgi:hypothetical protein